MQIIKAFLVFLIFNLYISKLGALVGIPVSLGAFICLFFIVFLVSKTIKFTIPQNNYTPLIKYIFYVSGIVLLFYTVKLPFYDLGIYSRVVAWFKFGVIPMIMFLPFAMKISKEQTDELVNFLMKLSVIPCLLGIIQFFFKDFLPSFLVNFSIASERSDDFMIGTVIYFRTNGLIGNPLEYSFFLLIIQTLSLSKFYLTGKKLYIYLYLISFLATVTTLSRFAFGGSLLIFLLVPLGYREFKKVLYLLFSLLLIGSFILVLYGDQIEIYSNISERLLSKSEESNNSTETRGKYFAITLNLISELPYLFTGYQIGAFSSVNESADKDLHDGFWFAVLLEQGVPFFIFYCYFWLYLLYRTIRNILLVDCVSISAFIIILLQMIGGIVNSSYFNMINCTLIFLLTGFSFHFKFNTSENNS